MRIIEQEESSDDDDDSSDEDDSQVEQNSDSQGSKDDKGAGSSEGDSFGSDNDILNRSLESASQKDEETVASEPENFLRFVSEKYNADLDILKIIDKNERSFKQVAEKMIQ